MKFKTELTSIHFGDTTIQVEGGVFEAEIPRELEAFLRSQNLISDVESEEVVEIKPEVIEEVVQEPVVEEVSVAKKPSTRKKKE